MLLTCAPFDVIFCPTRPTIVSFVDNDGRGFVANVSNARLLAEKVGPELCSHSSRWFGKTCSQLSPQTTSPSRRAIPRPNSHTFSYSRLCAILLTLIFVPPQLRIGWGSRWPRSAPRPTTSCLSSPSPTSAFRSYTQPHTRGRSGAVLPLTGTRHQTHVS